MGTDDERYSRNMDRVIQDQLTRFGAQQEKLSETVNRHFAEFGKFEERFAQFARRVQEIEASMREDLSGLRKEIDAREKQIEADISELRRDVESWKRAEWLLKLVLGGGLLTAIAAIAFVSKIGGML